MLCFGNVLSAPLQLWSCVIHVALGPQATSWGAGPLPATTVAALQSVTTSLRLVLTFSITSRLRSPFSCFLMLLSSAESVVSPGQTVNNTCVDPFFSAAVDKEKPSPPSLSSALAALKGGLSPLGPGDGLRALRNLLGVQPLAIGSCTASLCTTWRRAFVCFPFILLPTGSLWWLLSRKRWLDHSLCAFSVIYNLCLSHHSPSICLCVSGYLLFSGWASVTAALVWVVCKLALIKKSKPTNS